MLRLTHRRVDDHMVLRAEGRLAGAWVGLLERECIAAMADGSPVRLDLEQVGFVDADGLWLLRRLAEAGVRIHGNLLVRTLLGEEVTAP
jgi:anti-anti-sigma regulatory factor